MALKKPSDFFREDNKSDDIIHELVKRPELQSFSEAFDAYKNNLSKLDNLADTINCVEDIKSEIQDFIKKEDLDNSMMAYTFLLEESINKLKDDVKSINKKDLLQIQGDVSGLTEQINEFVEIEVPKYKSVVVESELRSSNNIKEFKEKISNIIEGIENSVEDFKKKSVSQLKEETLSTLDEKINLVVEDKNKDLEEEIKTLKTESISEYREFIVDNKLKSENNLNEFKETLDETISNIEIQIKGVETEIDGVRDNKDSLFKNLQKKIKEVKNLKNNIIEDLETSENHKISVNKKVSGLEAEIIRNESHLKENNKRIEEHNNNIKSIQGEVHSTLKRLNLDELERQNSKLTDKIKYLEEVFEKFSEKELLSEGILNITPETNNSDTLTPLNKNFVTLDQLQEHYRVFINRIQQQLSTLGGGGETQLQYLDDIVGIATNLSDYNGKFLKVDTSQPAGKNFVFATTAGGGYVLPTAAAGTLGGIKIGSGLSIDGDGVVTASGGGGSTGVGGTWAIDDVGISTTKKVGIGTTAKDGYSLYVQGDARITGILTVGEASITIDPSAKKLTGLDEIQIGSGTTAITIKKSESTGNIEFADEDGKEAPVGIGTTVNINTTGIITAANFSGIWSGTDIADDYITSASTWNSKIDNVSDDTDPQLGGNLDINSKNITGTGNIDITGDITISGTLTYEDVTNIESVGLITAKSGVVVVGGGVSVADGGLNVTSGITTVGFLTATDVWVSGGVTATTFNGSGANLTALNATNLASGTVETARLGSGTANSSTFLRGDGTWAAAGGGGSSKWTTVSGGIHPATIGDNIGIGTTAASDASLVVDVGTASTAVVVQGSEGQLFSVTNSLTSGSIFSVNDITGIPSIDVDADGTIQLAPYGSTENIGLGITNPSSKLHVVGGAKITGVLTTGQIADSNSSVGTAASVLSSTGSGLEWVAQSGGGGGGGASGLWESNATGINTSTNVGIGTTTASDASLTVDVGTASTAVVVQGSEGQLFSVTNSLSSGSIFSVNDISGVPSIDVDADGTIQLASYSASENIGLGITNPTSKLHVVGGARITGVLTTGQIADSNGNVGTAASVLSSTGSGLSWVAQSGGGGGSSNVSVANQADNRLISVTGTTDALNAEANLTFDGTNLDVSGNVGINSSAPETRLDVIAGSAGRTWTPGASVVSMFERNGTSRIAIVGNSSGSCEINFGDTTDDNVGYIKYDHSDNYMSFRTDTDEQLRIDKDGKVGIGSTTPSEKLDVVGTVKATDFNSTSDIRLKTNIQPIDDPLAKVIQIEGVSFNWKEDNKPALGVIADQVEEIIPQIVRGGPDTIKTVNYNGLIGLLIEAVKEQQIHIDNLNERISKLE